MTEEIKLILTLVATPAFSAVAIIIYLVLKPEKLDQWASLLYRFLSFIFQHLGVFKGRLELKRISSDIQAVINTSGQELSKEVSGALPYRVKVEWVDQQTVQSYLQQGTVIVRLNRHSDQDRNIVVSTLAYLSKGLLPRSRIYIDKVLRQATDFAVAKRMFASARGTGASEYFFTEVFEPTLEQTPLLRDDAALLDELETIGFFSRVYINELRELGERLQPAVPSERIHIEVRNFVHFLHTIAVKQKDVDVPLEYNGARVKLAVLLVARPAVLLEQGLRAYERRIDWMVRNGFNAIYINGWGRPNISSVRQLLDRLQKSGQLTVLQTHSYALPLHRADRSREESNRAILAVCSSNLAYLRKKQEAKQPVLEAMEQNVEAIREGKCEVVALERKVAFGTKIAIRVPNDSDAGSFIRALLASEEGLIPRLRQALGGESVFLIPWSSNISEYIVSALCLPAKDVADVELDEENLLASVYVRSERLVGLAVGKAGWNVETASQLVGWDIHVKVLGQDGKLPLEIQPVSNVLHEFIPELRNAKIQIEAIAREPEIGSKVLVRAKSEDLGLSPSLICRGDNNERLQLIRSELGNERITFHDWSDNPAELIVRALYPLNPRNVMDVQLNDIALEAEVLVKNYAAAQRAIGTNGVNVQLAEQLTSWKINVRVEGDPSGLESEDKQEALVHAVLKRHIREIEKEQIEVVRVAYEPGIGAKIGVRYREPKLRSRQDVIFVCLGSREQLNTLRDELAVGFLTFVEWSEDIKQNLIAALYPLEERDVHSVELDERNQRAVITVFTTKALAQAIGGHAQNLRLAQQLSGWRIYLNKQTSTLPQSA